MNLEDVLDLVEKFYTYELVESAQAQVDSKPKAKSKFNQGDRYLEYSAELATECENTKSC